MLNTYKDLNGIIFTVDDEDTVRIIISEQSYIRLCNDTHEISEYGAGLMTYPKDRFILAESVMDFVSGEFRSIICNSSKEWIKKNLPGVTIS